MANLTIEAGHSLESSESHVPSMMDKLANQSLRLNQSIVASHKPLVLVGMMGSGKSLCGKLLAQALKLSFIDADVEIEKAAGKTIAEIFAEEGEEFFRLREEKLIARLVTMNKDSIIATGGGAFVRDSTRHLIKQQAVSLWLQADLEVLWQRVRKKTHRPLLQQANPKQRLAEILAARTSYYAEADITFHSSEGDKSHILSRLIPCLLGWYDKPEGSRQKP